MSTSVYEFDLNVEREHFVEDDCVYQNARGERKPMFQQNWAAVSLAIGGQIMFTMTDWYDDRPYHEL